MERCILQNRLQPYDIIINDSRDKCLEDIMDFATCGQAGDGFCMFNTHSGNTIIAGIPNQIQKALK